MNLRNRIIATVGATALLATTALTGMAQTADETADVDIKINPINGGTVSVTIEETGTFGDVTYSLTENGSSTGVLTVVASDERGTAYGWTVRLTGEDFDGATLGDSIALSNLALTPDATALVTGVGIVPTTTSAPAFGTGAGPHTLWTADNGEGDGVFSLLMNGSLNVPAGTLVDTYEATLTVDITGDEP